MRNTLYIVSSFVLALIGGILGAHYARYFPRLIVGPDFRIVSYHPTDAMDFIAKATIGLALFFAATPLALLIRKPSRWVIFSGVTYFGLEVGCSLLTSIYYAHRFRAAAVGIAEIQNSGSLPPDFPPLQPDISFSMIPFNSVFLSGPLTIFLLAVVLRYRLRRSGIIHPAPVSPA